MFIEQRLATFSQLYRLMTKLYAVVNVITAIIKIAHSSFMIMSKYISHFSNFSLMSVTCAQKLIKYNCYFTALYI